MKNKNLSKKLNRFTSSPMLCVIAILEAIILVCVCTFAWFSYGEALTIRSGVLSVDPDSGLEIDFNVADKDGAVDINKYISNFEFEPVTSLDGRNLFVPTTGSFDYTATNSMKFREATVNDMNSKYISIDFTLTNTRDTDMDVFLNSKSYFKLNDNSSGKALRLAFYNNDGSHGAVNSDIISGNTEGTGPGSGSEGGDEEGKYLVYFDMNNLQDDGWDYPSIEADFTANSPNRCIKMDGPISTDPNDSGYNIYYKDIYYLIENSSNDFTFMKFHKNDGSSGNGTDVSHQFSNKGVAGMYSVQKDYLYSLKLDSNNDPLVTYENNSHLLAVNEPQPYTGTKPTVNPDNPGDITTDGGTTTFEQTTVYFYNARGWETPYAHIYNDSGELSAWPGAPLTKIAGDLYYHTFDVKFDKIIFSDGQPASVKGREQTVSATVNPSYIYEPTTLNKDKTIDEWVYYYNVVSNPYSGENDGDGYAVISPGVSAGFQRPYAPVVSINDDTGVAGKVVPAFASSIENYSYGSKKLFTIKSQHTLSLSMIIWLEGTDDDCINENYLGKYIDMELIFATEDYPEALYTYKFLDKTNENWLDDNVVSATGISYKPVIQLYDVDSEKGYMMNLAEDGKTWSCTAPQSLVDSDAITFRRVNPLNENEVWNFWETDGFKNYTCAFSDENSDGDSDTVTFSAFADGAPTWDSVKSNPNQPSIKNVNLPERSCGGLWGNYETGTMYVFDGTDTRWLKNSNTDGATGVLTINYELNDQRIEYKASADNTKGLYSFIVPVEVCKTSVSNRPNVLIKRYYNFFEGLAMNDISKNPDICFHKMWSNSKSGGWFYQISDAGEEDASYGNGYWGNDMLYVESTYNMLEADGKVQVRFYKDSYNSTNFYSYLYENSAFEGNSDYGFACVIPSNAKYNKYVVERASQQGTIWGSTAEITALNVEGNNAPYNITAANNICKITGYISTGVLGYELYNDPNKP